MRPWRFVGRLGHGIFMMREFLLFIKTWLLERLVAVRIILCLRFLGYLSNMEPCLLDLAWMNGTQLGWRRRMSTQVDCRLYGLLFKSCRHIVQLGAGLKLKRWFCIMRCFSFGGRGYSASGLDLSYLSHQLCLVVENVQSYLLSLAPSLPTLLQYSADLLRVESVPFTINGGSMRVF